MIARDRAPGHVGGRRGEGDLSALLGRAAHGDVDAFMRFYDATVAVVYRYARARSGDPAKADELTRALYARAWRAAPGHHRSGLSPLAWLLVHAPSRQASTATPTPTSIPPSTRASR